MLPHIKVALETLAAKCLQCGVDDHDGWSVDWWELDADSATAAVAVYSDLLRGGSTESVRGLLIERGIDLDAYLLGAESRDEITRSDLTELIAAASIVARDGWSPDGLHMPNVPKMARKKSDSGIDVMGVFLDAANEGFPEGDERLILVSVKHTVQGDTSQLRSSLLKSVTDDLSRPYLAAQFRVLSGRLMSEGATDEQAARVYLFLDVVEDGERVDLLAVGVADASVLGDFKQRVERLPRALPAKRFRGVVVPGLATIASRCPS